MTATIIQPGQIEAPADDIAFLRLPARQSVFKDRAARFRQLATDHKLGDFLAFMARIADAQQAALDQFPQVPLPDAARLALLREPGIAPLAASGWQRHPAWQEALHRITDAAVAVAPKAARDILVRLRGMDAAILGKQADAILGGRFQDVELGSAPFIAAALQVYWVHMSTTLGAEAFGCTEPANLCPVCASPPVASIVRSGSAAQGLRYLHCSLCAGEWHMVRSKCSNCESTKDIAYYGIEGDNGAIRAEACQECSSYLKILYLEKDPQLDPTADDLASLSLDLLMDESGMQRSGPNLFFVAKKV